MFETLFTYSRVLRRHREGPLAEERAAYLADLAAQCVAPATLIKKARCCLRVAVELERWPADHCFDNDEVCCFSHSLVEPPGDLTGLFR